MISTNNPSKNRCRRKAALTAFAQRLTPSEVAQNWFRRASDFGPQIRVVFPDFPSPAPDGLFLVDDVKLWFDQYHGKRQTLPSSREAEAEAYRIARYGRR